MRIAILSPYSIVEKRANAAASLADELASRGNDVTLFATPGTQTKAKLAAYDIAADGASVAALEAMNISAALERGNDFELIHNFAGLLPASFCGMTSTPMLSTISDGLSADMRAVKERYIGRAFFACTCGPCCPAEIQCIGVVGEEEGAAKMADGYIEIYKKILDLRKREDHRPWGYYVIYSDNPTHKVKRIVVYPGQRLSLQRHARRAEHWYVIAGQGAVTLDDREVILEAGQAVDISVGTWHRMRNPGDTDMAFIEVQTGDYFGEDDIERAQDDYGRN